MFYADLFVCYCYIIYSIYSSILHSGCIHFPRGMVFTTKIKYLHRFEFDSLIVSLVTCRI